MLQTKVSWMRILKAVLMPKETFSEKIFSTELSDSSTENPNPYKERDISFYFRKLTSWQSSPLPLETGSWKYFHSIKHNPLITRTVTSYSLTNYLYFKGKCMGGLETLYFKAHNSSKHSKYADSEKTTSRIL